MERAENAALAAEVFDQFCSAGTLKAILSHHRHLCSLLHIRPASFNQFYPKLKSKLRSWKAQALWNKFDKRASHKCYNRGKACTNARVLVIGAGPCGLRAAIEAQLLGAKVVVVEKRDRITRNNVLHLWPFVIHDLRALGAKKFFGRFCAGAIDHISIRQLQCILLKVALILGIEIHEGVGFESLLPPTQDQATERVGWRASTSPADHPVSQYEFNVLIGADGKRNTLDGFKRKEFRGKLAIAITANFINRHTEAEARVEEISGVAFIFNQKFFKELYATTGIDLENIVYYKDDTHYFVMTAKKHSLIDKGVIRVDYSDTAKLLSPDNVDKTALMDYAKEAADFSTGCRLPQLEFAVNHYGQPDVAMFDFTSMYAAENASRFVEISGHTLLVTLVGDSLLEPFWPTGSGCARGFLSSMDACWAIRSWCLGLHPLEVLAERESIYRLLGQTTPENLHRDLQAYTLDPHTRYPNLNSRSVLPIQVRGLFSTDDTAALEHFLKEPNNSQPPTLPQEIPKKRRRRDGHVHAETLLHWLQRQVSHYPSIKVVDITHSFKDGLALCAIVHRYRPHLLDFAALDPSNATHNNQLAFDILERELAIPPVMTGEEMANCEVPDSLTMLTYLSQVYEAFRGEIPHIKHPKLDDSAEELAKPEDTVVVKRSSLSRLRQGHQRVSSGGAERAVSRTLRRSHVRSHASLLEHENAVVRGLTRILEKSISDSLLPNKDKWYDVDWRSNPGEARRRLQADLESRRRRQEDIERLRSERYMHRKYLRHIANQQFYKSMQMLQTNALQTQQENNEPFEDYSLFVYRMTAPDFKERVKQLENKLLYPDRENRPGVDGGQRGASGQEISGRVKDLEAKFKGVHYDKKPKDLLRAIGKIEKTDWNVKQIEKKIEENRMGRGSSRKSEKVPKWSKQQFDDKFTAVERKLKARSADAHADNKYTEIDTKMSRLEKRIKEGINLEMGRRGANKVSAMAAHLATIHKQPEPHILQVGKPSNPVVMQPPTQGGSELCHFCSKRVYLMERLSAEGKFFHRGCFKCQYCSSSLRLGNYAFDREGKYGSKFYCVQHFGLQNIASSRRQGSVRTEETIRNATVPDTSGSQSPKRLTPVAEPQTPKFSHLATTNVSGVLEEEIVDVAVATPERVEFENLSDCVEVEEDEWTDRNFGLSATDVSDTSQDSATDSDSDNYAEAEDGGLDPAEETLRLAKDWTRKYGSSYSTDSQEEDSDTETEDDNFKKGGNAARQSDSTGSETEVASDEECSSSSSEEDNSATEISTDSEFEHDGTTHMIPDIVISETVQVKRCHIEQPKQVQIVSSRQLNGKIQAANNDRKHEHNNVEKEKPLLNNLINNNNVTKPSLPFINPNRGDYMLNRTQSTEGIASRLSLELKKKYLLGPTTGKSEVRKSGSSSILDTKFKSLIDNISETQKLLNPAPVPSPTMQAFLQGADKLKSSPIKLLEKKELPAKGFKHICNLKTEIIEASKQKEEEEERVRSPVHETSIVVPEFPRSAPKEPEEAGKEIESDSLSSEISTSTEDEEGDESGKEETPIKSPPKLEIHNSRGELMEDTPEMDSLNMPDICKAENERSPIRDKLDLVQVGPKVITAPTGDLLTQVSTTAELYKDISSPPSPDSDSLKNDVTVLTETELSDWARDEDGVVSETLDDLEFNINPQYITIRPPKRGMKIAKTEDLEDEYQHICGKANPLDLDNLEFMDTAGESSGSESSGARNKLLLNRGYVQFVNNEDDLTPVAEAVNMLEVLEVETSKEELTDTTTSEPTTVKDSPGEPPPLMQILSTRSKNFVNARDSLEVAKARSVAEPKGNTLNSPATSRKLEQISQERAKQKDLIHEMVMNKLGRSPREQLQNRPKRSRSRTFSPSTTPPQVPQVSTEIDRFEKSRPEKQIITKQANETPKTSSPRQRSLTVSSSWRSTDTPRTEACSLPDIHMACSGISLDSASCTPFRTPLAVPNLRSGLKEQARAKFKMMSDEELGLSPEDKIKKFKIKIQKHLQDTPKNSSPSASPGEKPEGNKKSKEDRKRSIIQAVSDFFHKKSPSPPKTPSSSHSPTKNISLLSTTKERDNTAPPVPPPPQSYVPSHEDSVSEDDICDNSTADNTSLVKRQRLNRRLARLQQSKRLRMAQEVQRELEELEVKQKELEAKGVAVEKALRGEDTGMKGSESELLSEWLRLMRERSEARSKEKVLLIRGQEIELEHRHARLQNQLSQLMSSTPDGEKTSEEVALEGRILREMLEIVERRDSLQGQLEAERLRFQEEDKDLEAQMKAKGLQLTAKQ
ncbi:molecule interacting with CasL isoform X2 [Rhodnius prolixus]|uniref:molecule interacting with CasL isoform X2 n=1 Tax=Rhodnius prolixus TaxID=13249 RepID=UPI003D18855D